MGFNGDMYWAIGRVEDVNDPKEIGRIKVRWFGVYSDNDTDLPVSDIPWSYVMDSVSSASSGGVGCTPHGLMVGSWVVGFFLDGRRAQQAIVIGSLNGVHKTSFIEKSESINDDPNNQELGGIEHEDISESKKFWKRAASTDDSLHPLNRTPKKNTSQKTKIKFINDNPQSTTLDDKYTPGLFLVEPPISDTNPYGDNQVLSFKDGSYISWGTSKDFPCYQKYHFKSHNFEEIDSGGNHKIRTPGSRIEFTGKSAHQCAQFDHDITAQQGDLKLFAGAETSLETRSFYTDCKGDYDLHVDGNMTIKCSGTFTVDAAGIKLLARSGRWEAYAKDELNLECAMDMNIQSGNDVIIESRHNLNMNSHNCVNLRSEHDIHVHAERNIFMNAKWEKIKLSCTGEGDWMVKPRATKKMPDGTEKEVIFEDEQYKEYHGHPNEPNIGDNSSTPFGIKVTPGELFIEANLMHEKMRPLFNIRQDDKKEESEDKIICNKLLIKSEKHVEAVELHEKAKTITKRPDPKSDDTLAAKGEIEESSSENNNKGVDIFSKGGILLVLGRVLEEGSMIDEKTHNLIGLDDTITNIGTITNDSTEVHTKADPIVSHHKLLAMGRIIENATSIEEKGLPVFTEEEDGELKLLSPGYIKVDSTEMHMHGEDIITIDGKLLAPSKLFVNYALIDMLAHPIITCSPTRFLGLGQMRFETIEMHFKCGDVGDDGIWVRHGTPCFGKLNAAGKIFFDSNKTHRNTHNIYKKSCVIILSDGESFIHDAVGSSISTGGPMTINVNEDMVIKTGFCELTAPHDKIIVRADDIEIVGDNYLYLKGKNKLRLNCNHKFSMRSLGTISMAGDELAMVQSQNGKIHVRSHGDTFIEAGSSFNGEITTESYMNNDEGGDMMDATFVTQENMPAKVSIPQFTLVPAPIKDPEWVMFSYYPLSLRSAVRPDIPENVDKPLSASVVDGAMEAQKSLPACGALKVAFDELPDPELQLKINEPGDTPDHTKEARTVAEGSNGCTSNGCVGLGVAGMSLIGRISPSIADRDGAQPPKHGDVKPNPTSDYRDPIYMKKDPKKVAGNFDHGGTMAIIRTGEVCSLKLSDKDVIGEGQKYKPDNEIFTKILLGNKIIGGGETHLAGLIALHCIKEDGGAIDKIAAQAGKAKVGTPPGNNHSRAYNMLSKDELKELEKDAKDNEWWKESDVSKKFKKKGEKEDYEYLAPFMANSDIIGTDNKDANQVGDEILAASKMLAVHYELGGSGSVAECAILSRMSQSVWKAWQRSRTKDWPWGMWSTPNLYIVRGIDAKEWSEFLKFHPKEITTPNMTIDAHHKAWINSLFKPYKRLGQARLRPLKGSSEYSPMEMLKRGIPWPDSLEQAIKCMFGSNNNVGIFGGTSPIAAINSTLKLVSNVTIDNTSASNNTIFGVENISNKVADLLSNMKSSERLTQGDVVTYFFEFLHGKSLGDKLPEDIPYDVINPFPRTTFENHFGNHIEDNIEISFPSPVDTFSNNLYTVDDDANNDSITIPRLKYVSPYTHVPENTVNLSDPYFVIPDGCDLFVSFGSPNNHIGQVLDSWITIGNNMIYQKVYDEYRPSIYAPFDPYIGKWIFGIGNANENYGNTTDMYVNIKNNHVSGPKYKGKWNVGMSNSTYEDGRSIITYEPDEYLITLFTPNNTPISNTISICLNDNKLYRYDTSNSTWYNVPNTALAVGNIILGEGLPMNYSGTINDLWIDINTSLLYGPKDSSNNWTYANNSYQLSPVENVLYNFGQPNTSTGNTNDLCINVIDKMLYGPKCSNNYWPHVSNNISFNDYAKFTYGFTVPSYEVIKTEKEGDIFLDIVTHKLYVKQANNWADTNKEVLGMNIMHHADGPPENSFGNDGEFYYDTLYGVVYGPKTNGDWYGTYVIEDYISPNLKMSYNPKGGSANTIYQKTQGDF
jgi:hypothetical protein